MKFWIIYRMLFIKKLVMFFLNEGIEIFFLNFCDVISSEILWDFSKLCKSRSLVIVKIVYVL